MPLFSYRAYSRSGDLREGEVEADSAEGATQTLWLQGLTVFEAKRSRTLEPSTPWWRREIYSSSRVKASDLAAFTREFAILEQAEVAIDDGLRILCEHGSNGTMRELAREVLNKVLAGSSLSDALRARPDAFSQEYVNMVRAGEADGALERVLSDLASLLEQRLEVRSRLRTALIYPAILVLMAIASVSTVVGVLIPSVAPILTQGGRPLPSGLGLLIALQRHWLTLALSALAATAAAATLARAASKNPAIRLRFDEIVLRVPTLGSFLARRDCARFARTLGALVRARVPLLQALACARAVIVNGAIGESVAAAIEAVGGGDTLTKALARIEAWPAIVARMISVGEETGRLDHMLLRLSDMFAQQTQRQVDRAMSLVTPLLTILISILVGGLIYTVMNAILSINELAVR